MKAEITISGKEVILNMPDFLEEFDVDDVLKIDYSNLYGEAITINVLVNHIGLMRAEAEEELSKAELRVEVREASFRKNLRREANNNGGKFTIREGDEDGGGMMEYKIKLTEDSIKEAARSDKGIQILKNNVIKAKKTYEQINSFYWAVQKKASQLENWTQKVTPQEFANEIVEDVINGIKVKKRKSITERKSRRV